MLIITALLVAAPAPVVFNRVEPVAVTASSELRDSGNKHEENWLAPYAADDDPKTAWVEGKPDEGKGESITLKLAGVKGASQLKIVVANGFQKSDVLLKQNAAPKTLHVTAKASGKVVGEKDLALEKQMGTQYFLVPLAAKADVDEVSFRIDDVHKGTKYKDTCVSDLQVFADGVVDGALQRKQRTALNAWRTPKLEAAKLAASDFAAATFMKASEQPKHDGDGEGTLCTGVDSAEFDALEHFADGREPAEGVYVAVPENAFPFGMDGGYGWVGVGHLDVAHTKASKEFGRHKEGPDGGTATASMFQEHTDLFVVPATHRAYMSDHTHGIGDALDSASGTAVILDDKGRVTAEIGFSSTEHTPDEPGEGGDRKSYTSLLFHRDAKGKIDTITEIAADCSKTTYKPAQ